MKKIYSIMICLGLSVTGMAQQNFELGKPNDDNYRYLDEYAALKEYVNRDKYPNFRLGLATIVSDYIIIAHGVNSSITMLTRPWLAMP